MYNLNGFSSSVVCRREDFDFDGAQDLKDNSLETKEDDGLNAENLSVENRIDNRLDNMQENQQGKNFPYLLFGNKKLDSAVYTIDFAKINNRKEYMACGCGDGGVRLFTIDISH